MAVILTGRQILVVSFYSYEDGADTYFFWMQSYNYVSLLDEFVHQTDLVHS